jgi:hypothetical protein
MITVLVMIVIVAALVSTASLIAIGNRQRSTDSATTTKAQYAAEAGVELALKKIFHDPYDLWAASLDAQVKNVDGQTVKFDSCAFKKWLTGLGNTATTTQLENNKAKDCPYVNFPTVATGAPFPNLVSDATQTLTSNDADVPENLKIAGATYSVDVTRRDRTDGTVVLEMTVVGQVEQGGRIQAQRRLRRSVQIAADVFEGDKFGMLTSSTNCSFCHLQIDTMRRAYATDTTKKFERVKVGMLSVRSDATVTLGDGGHNGSDSLVYGSMYVRAPKSKINFGNTTATPYTTANTHYVLNSDGTVNVGDNNSMTKNLLKDDASIAFDVGPTATTLPGPNKPLYYNYPTSTQVQSAPYNGKWPDINLPDSFPSPIPDNEGNSNISDAEWKNYMDTRAPRGKVIFETGSKLIVYGVKRPSSNPSLIDATIPVAYDPITANALTSGSSPVNFAAVIANPSSFKGWIMAQALASPNNRDFMPVRYNTSINNNLDYALVAGQGTTRNNFYVRYNPTLATNNLSLFYCTATVDTSCSIGGDPTATPTSSMASVSVTVTDADWFPKTSNAALNDLTSGTKSGRAGYFDGNLIIDAGRKEGTTNTALFLDGSIYANGDVVIRGRVRGSGRIVARGNIYVVGDLVYDCASGLGACTTADYAALINLPKLALLAGGNVVVGDYDFPDTRVNLANRTFDLINDQAGQNRIPNTSATSASPINWATWTIPGSTGRPPYDGLDNWDTAPTSPATRNTNGRGGFVLRVLDVPNSRATPPRYFKMNPFGLILGNSGTPEPYENGNLATFVSNVSSASIISLYPSNGPFRIGSNSNQGLAYTGMPSQLGCSNTTTPQTIRRWGTNLAAGNTTQQGLNFGYWCPPSTLTGSYVRKDGTAGTMAGTSTPGTNTSVWMAQSTQDAALDANVGLTTGWLGGLTTVGGNIIRGDLSQTRLLKLMWLATTEKGRTKGPLRTDGILYSANMITSVLRGSSDNRSGDSNTQSRWIHNGSVIASELGFLITASNNGVNASGTTFTLKRNTTMDFNAATGNSTAGGAGDKGWGAGIGIFYDDRLSGFLQITNTNEVKIRRTGIFNQEATK